MLRIQRRGYRDQEGFTLIELAIALAILGILVAIAVPTYLGVRNKAYDSEAKQTLGEIRALAWSHFLEENEWPTDVIALGYEDRTGTPDSDLVFETEIWDYVMVSGSGAASGSMAVCAEGKAGQPSAGRSWLITLDDDGTAEIEGFQNATCTAGP